MLPTETGIDQKDARAPPQAWVEAGLASVLGAENSSALRKSSEPEPGPGALSIP